MSTKNIIVGYLACVEGEGALSVKMRGDKVTDVKLKIMEPPRFFEAFLRGRTYSEAPDITARICGIWPVAYQMSAVHAMEHTFEVVVDGQLRALRRLLYCGEWIESHTLHVYMLHAPDFLGYPDVVRMAQDHPDVVKRGLRMKKAGNAIVAFLGGREVHPINVRVGGFYSVPEKREFAPLVEELKWGRDAALETVRWAAQMPFPAFEQDYEFVACGTPTSTLSTRDTWFPIKGWISPSRTTRNTLLKSRCHIPARCTRGSYFVGPLARYNLNFALLSPLAQEAARAAGLGSACRNPFQSIIVRSVEILYAFDEALRLIEEYEKPEQPAVSVRPRAATGCACTEAPRGILYHRYLLDDEGVIRDARIIPPTSQNQKTIENDLWHYVEQYIQLPQEQLTWQCEQAIRNYDPCISCSTHFLELAVERE